MSNPIKQYQKIMFEDLMTNPVPMTNQVSDDDDGENWFPKLPISLTLNYADYTRLNNLLNGIKALIKAKPSRNLVLYKCLMTGMTSMERHLAKISIETEVENEYELEPAEVKEEGVKEEGNPIINGFVDGLVERLTGNKTNGVIKEVMEDTSFLHQEVTEDSKKGKLA